MDDNILRKMAVWSTALMLIVILISIVTVYYKNNLFYGKIDNIVEEVMAISLKDATLSEMEFGEESSEFISKIGHNEAIKDILGDRYFIIDKPLGNRSQIRIEDIYMERSIKIKLHGITEKTFGYNSILGVKGENSYFVTTKEMKLDKKKEDKKEEFEIKGFASNVLITYEHDSENNDYTAIIDMVLDSVYVYTIYEDDLHYYINFQKPKDVYDKLIVVDAGHGGNDIGTFTNGMEYIEKDLNLSIVHYLKDFLDKEKSIKVYYTRLKDEKPFLRPRVRLANDLNADFFISVHCNGSEMSEPSGIEVLYNETSKKRGFDSKVLSQICLEELNHTISLRNRGLVEGSEKYIVGHAKVPVALCEIGYLSNTKDLEFLKEPKNRKRAAKGIYNGIMRAFKVLEKEQ